MAPHLYFKGNPNKTPWLAKVDFGDIRTLACLWFLIWRHLFTSSPGAVSQNCPTTHDLRDAGALALETIILQNESHIQPVTNLPISFLFVFEIGSPTAQFQLELACISQNDLEFLCLRL